MLQRVNEQIRGELAGAKVTRTEEDVELKAQGHAQRRTNADRRQSWDRSAAYDDRQVAVGYDHPSTAATPALPSTALVLQLL